MVINPVAIVAIVFGAIVVTIGIIAFTILSLANGRRANGMSAVESQLMQELHQGLLRMERRVETLETLLLERESKGR